MSLRHFNFSSLLFSPSPLLVDVAPFHDPPSDGLTETPADQLQINMSAGQLARRRSTSQGSRPSLKSPSPIGSRPMDTVSDFEPCAATASTFLYAQGSSIICLHHDTLAVDRTFEKHDDQVLLVSVDNVSERGSGRLVVSYDAGQTAIVWDLFTGDEIARFAAYEHIRVAAWMRNGNVAFGRLQLSALSALVLIPRQETPKATSFSSNLPLPSTFPREQFSIQSPLLLLLRIAGLTPLGTFLV